jgi:dTDP-4-amino-4,6-dideoxygalactose transaminase
MINVTQTFLPPLEEYTALLSQIWSSKWLTNRGKLVQELESKLKDYLGIPDILTVSNGTIALQLAIKALDLKGEVITTPFSYVATVSSIVWEGCRPVFVDIHPEYLTIDEEKIEDAITENTTSILATHVFGNPCDVEAIAGIAERHKLKVIYDAAHCFGVDYKQRSILEWGEVSTLSFHATKLFHTAEGGAIVTPQRELAAKIFYHHNFGHHGEEEFWGLGVNGKISEINAALGLAMLPHLDAVITKRAQVCEIYDEMLGNGTIQRLKLRPETKWNYSYYPVLFDSESTLLRVKRAMNDVQIFPRRYFYPSLNRLPYLEYQPVKIAEDASSRILCLPLSTVLEEKDITRICDIVNNHG